MPKKDKNILLGVTSSVALYKSCELVRLLRKDGFAVKVVMTPASTKLITPYLFETLSQNPVYCEMFAHTQEYSIEHIALAEWASVCVVAPCTLATLSKLATGVCDNLLTTTVFSFNAEKKILLAPAMNTEMWKNPVTQDNLDVLRRNKRVVLVGPAKGPLACGVSGTGRMAEPREILSAIKAILA